MAVTTVIFPNGPVPQGQTYSADITASTVIKTSPGVVVGACVTTAGTSAGAVFDNNGTTIANTATNQVGVLGTLTTGYIAINAICGSGIVVSPGTSQVVTLFYI